MHKDYYEKAAQDPDPMMRLAIFTAAIIGQYTTLREGKEKCFSPLAGETFEYVTDDFRYFAE